MMSKFESVFLKDSEEELLDFLKTLTTEQKKEIVPNIKKLNKEYNEYRDMGNGRYGYRGTEAQRSNLLISSFVCFNQVDFEKSPTPFWILKKNELDKILPWYCPKWFEDFVNKQAGQEFISSILTYDWVMELNEDGHLKPSRELLASIMPGMLFDRSRKLDFFKPEILLKRAITLDQHVWLLFELDSNIHYAERFLHFGDDVSKDNVGWIPALKKYCDEGKIDRKRLLKESILASNRNFHKVLSGWFVDLFLALEPTTEEILRLQKEMLSVLSSPHSKPVNTVLNHFKKLMNEKEFDDQAFLDQCPILLSSNTKSIVLSTLQLIEKLASKNKQLKKTICSLCVQAFFHADEQLQLKAAEIINDNKTSLDPSFINELLPYESSIMSNAKKLLADLVGTKEHLETEPVVLTSQKKAGIEELKSIPPIETLDDLVFFASQAVDNNNSWDIDLLPAAFIKFYPQIKGKEVDRFEPALQRALKFVRDGIRSNTGRYDVLLAAFIIDVCIDLIRKHPIDSTLLKKLFDKFSQNGGGNKEDWLDINENSSYIFEWKEHFQERFYQPYVELLLTALEKLRKGDNLPLLSTPTHEPAWISVDALVERLIVYKRANKMPGEMDFEMAILRCYKQGTSVTASLNDLNGEFSRLIKFLLEIDAEPVGPFEHPNIWLTASMARTDKKRYAAFGELGFYQKPFHEYIGQYEWKSVNEDCMVSVYDFKTGKYLQESGKDRQLYVKVRKKEEGKEETETKKAAKPLSNPQDRSLVEFLTIDVTYLTVEHNDIRRALLLSPLNPDPLLAYILSGCLRYPDFFQENDKKTVKAAIQVLFEIWGSMQNMAHVFLGTCMISADKTIANIAAEIWLKGISNSTINNEQLGKAIGLHERVEFAPLKRFTDLAMKTLFRISTTHNKALQELIGYILIELSDEPITNLKKLLEVYAELLVINNSKIADERILGRLKVWKCNSGLKKIVAALQG